MKKTLLFLLVAMLLLSVCSFGVFAANPYMVAVETPVEMSLVEETDGGYEYNVKVNATVTDGEKPVSKYVSLLMFGNKDNSAFVQGDTQLSLTVDEVIGNYHVYYIDQETSGSDGKASFDFNVILPTPAASDKYYIWTSVAENSAPGQLDGDNLSVNTDAFSVSVTLDKSSVIAGEEVKVTPVLTNLFTKAVAQGEASVEYYAKKDGVDVSISVIDGVIGTGALSGDYSIYARLTRRDGTFTDSAPVILSVSETENETRLGDVDNNTKIDTFDAVLVLKHVASIITLEDSQLKAADVDGTNSVEIADATTLLKYIARIINKF